MCWRVSEREVVVQSIAATTTRTGLRVHAELDAGQYPTGVEVSDADMAAVPIARHAFQPLLKLHGTTIVPPQNRPRWLTYCKPPQNGQNLRVDNLRSLRSPNRMIIW